jgi:glutamyl-tRNA(Gln) amidotransferase subunit E
MWTGESLRLSKKPAEEIGAATKTLPIDFRALQLKVGLELHQQLATREKLFCPCAPLIPGPERESAAASDFPIRFKRILRPTVSELGEMDEAARFESRSPIVVHYYVNPKTSCLVEADEEPPHEINNEAIEDAVLFALTLHSRIVDEIHVMRKIVIDGSNTSGFQRTAIVAMGGILHYGDGKEVGVQTITLEEDAARAIKSVGSREDEVRSYALDRLGTPLVEVALAPIEGAPEDVQMAAASLGRMERSTRRVARGLGTIRQDINLSIMGGNVVEVKGVQKLELLSKVITFEALRQKFFHDLSFEIRKKLGNEIKISRFEATHLFSNTQSSVLSRKEKVDQSSFAILCIVAKGLSGYFGRENEMHSRLGKELGAIARTYHLGGVIHSDELPGYGITSEEIENLRNKLAINEEDAFVLLAGSRSRVEGASEMIIHRIKSLPSGVPAETRAATEEGETIFLRPRPGAARMYPETDIQLIQVSKEQVEKLTSEIPEPWEKQVKAFSQKYSLPLQLGEPLFGSERRVVFEEIVAKTAVPSSFVASVLVDQLSSLEREVLEVKSISDERLLELFDDLKEGRFAKEALPEILRVAASPEGQSLSREKLSARAGVRSMNSKELDELVDKVIKENALLVRQKGRAAKSALMGRVMREARGKVDGKIVNDTLERKLEQYLKQSASQ